MSLLFFYDYTSPLYLLTLSATGIHFHACIESVTFKKIKMKKVCYLLNILCFVYTHNLQKI